MRYVFAWKPAFYIDAALLMLCLLGCTSEDSRVIPNSPDSCQSIELFTTIHDNHTARSFWQEDCPGSIDSKLLYHWEDDKSGKMKAVLTNQHSLKPYQNDGYCANVDIHTTEQRNMARLNISTPLSPDDVYAVNDSLYTFFPVVHPYSSIVCNTKNKVEFSFSVPNELEQLEPNSTKQIAGYLYSIGKGKIVEKSNILQSQLVASALPVALRFHIVNKETPRLQIQNVSIRGTFSTKGVAEVTPQGCNVQYYESDNNTLSVSSQLELEGSESANLYGLLLPTHFTPGEQLLFNFQGKYANGWTAIFENVPLDCKIIGSELLSNSCYYIDLEVTRDYLYIVVNGVKIQGFKKGCENNDIELLPDK